MEPTGMGFAPLNSDPYAAMRPRSNTKTTLQPADVAAHLDSATPDTQLLHPIPTDEDYFADQDHPTPPSSASSARQTPVAAPPPAAPSIMVAAAAARFTSLRPRSSTTLATTTLETGSSQSPELANRQRSATMTFPPQQASPMSAGSVPSGSTPAISGATAGHHASSVQKRKRSRVTPEQLMHLERVFSIDRSPTAARRKEISESLGMQERQTQIWFQNRRAKAKLQESRGRSGRNSPGSDHHHGTGDSPPNTPPELSSASDYDLQALLREEHPILVIPCVDLSIGSWRRIASSTGRHDLVAYKCDAKRTFTWFIYSSNHGFKMEIPFETIKNTEFTPEQPGQARASFTLSQAPSFYMEQPVTLPGSVVPVRQWKKCADWTEGMQASNVRRHELVGSAAQLWYALNGLPGGPAPNPSVVLSPHGYLPRSPDPSTGLPPLQMQIPPPPPIMGLPTPASSSSSSYHLTNPSMQHLHNMMHGRKRSFSGPAAFHNPLDIPTSSTSSLANDSHSQAEQALHSNNNTINSNAVDASASQQHQHSNFISPTQRPTTIDFFNPSFIDPAFAQYPMTTTTNPIGSSNAGPATTGDSSNNTSHHHQSRHAHGPSLTEFSSIPISHAVAPRGSLVPRMPSYTTTPPSAGDPRIPAARRYSEVPTPTPYSPLTSPLLATPYAPGEPRIVENPTATMHSQQHPTMMMNHHHQGVDLSGYSYVSDESPLLGNPPSAATAPSLRSTPPSSDRSSSLSGALGASMVDLGKQHE